MTRLPDLVGRWFQRRLRARLVITAVSVLVVAAASWTPAVRMELRRSFTRLPTEYAELYFTRTPEIVPYGARSAAVVPVTLVDHGATARDYEVRFTLTDARGAVVSTSTATLHARPEVPAGTLRRMRIAERGRLGPYLVRVTLTGRPQTLHYRIDSKGTP
jgi:hypothetical protein